MAFLGAENDRQVIGVDDRDLAAYTDREPHFPLAFSGDGRVVAYLLTDAKARRTRLVVDGREGPAFESAGPPSLSRDGRVVAHWASADDGHFVRIGDREEPRFDFVTDPAVSADGSTVAYGACRGGRWMLRAGSVERAIAGKPVSVFIADDGRNVGWIEQVPMADGGCRMRVVVGDAPGETFNLVGKPVFRPGSALVAYGAEEGGRRFAVIGNRKVETPDRIGDLSFSPDGRLVGYGARVGRELWWKVIEIEGHE